MLRSIVFNRGQATLSLRGQGSLSPLSILTALLWAAPALAGIWPGQIGDFKRVSAAPPVLSERAVWDEYGLDETEKATYEGASQKFIATAWRLRDTTGAFAAFQWQRPAKARPSKLADLAVETDRTALVAYGNYLLHFDGWKPQVTDIAALVDRVPKLEKSALPTLPGYMPGTGLIANSERYILGPASLERFRPGIPPSVAAFHMGAEGQVANFRSPEGEMALVIFSYPTPHIARDQWEAFRKLPGAVAKRDGTLVAAIFSPPNPDAAERLLALVRYHAEVTLTEYIPTRRDNIGDLILNIFMLTGILVLFCAAAGLAYGGILALSRHWRGGAGDPMIMLHLEDR